MFDPYVLSLPFPLDAFHREPVPTFTTSKPQTSTNAIRKRGAPVQGGVRHKQSGLGGEGMRGFMLLSVRLRGQLLVPTTASLTPTDQLDEGVARERRGQGVTSGSKRRASMQASKRERERERVKARFCNGCSKFCLTASTVQSSRPWTLVGLGNSGNGESPCWGARADGAQSQRRRRRQKVVTTTRHPTTKGQANQRRKETPTTSWTAKPPQRNHSADMETVPWHPPAAQWPTALGRPPAEAAELSGSESEQSHRRRRAHAVFDT